MRIRKRIKNVIEKKGYLALIKRVFYFKRTGEIHERILDDSQDYPNPSCGVENLKIDTIFIPKMLTAEYEDLGDRGFDFSTHPDAQEYKKGLQGTIVFWITTNNELVHRTAYCTSRIGSVFENLPEEYQNPITMDEAGDIVYPGAAETVVKYRRKGVYYYAWANFYFLLKEIGFKKILIFLPDDIIPSQIIVKKLGSVKLCNITFLRYFLFIKRIKFS